MGSFPDTDIDPHFLFTRYSFFFFLQRALESLSKGLHKEKCCEITGGPSSL